MPDEQLSVFGASGDVDGLLPEQLTKKFAPGQRREKVRKEVGGGRVVNDLSGSGPRQDEEGIQWIGWNNSIDFRSSPFLARNVCCWVGKPLGTIGAADISRARPCRVMGNRQTRQKLVWMCGCVNLWQCRGVDLPALLSFCMHTLVLPLEYA